MTLAILGLSGPGDHRTTNALKNLLNVLANVVAIGIYIVHGIVAWPETTAMMAGALLDGFVGGRSMRFLPAPLSFSGLWWSEWVRSLRSYSHGATGWPEPLIAARTRSDPTLRE